MALQFGVGKLTVSGIAVARLHNVTVNFNYDMALMRGGNQIFADACQPFNGTIEGSFEAGELILSAISDIIGGTGTYAAGSGTWTLSATNFPTSGVQVIFSGVTDGITCTVTLQAVRFNSLALNFDRENYLMPGGNFQCVGNSSADTLISIQM